MLVLIHCLIWVSRCFVKSITVCLDVSCRDFVLVYTLFFFLPARRSMTRSLQAGSKPGKFSSANMRQLDSILCYLLGSKLARYFQHIGYCF